MKYLLLVLTTAIGLSACSGDNAASAPDKDVLMRNDFEELVGWIPDPVALTQEKAHSGRYSLKVDPAHEYSMGYNYLLGQLSPTRIQGIKVEAWAYAPEKDPTAQIRVAINNVAGGTPIMSEGIDFSSQVKEYGKWVKVSKEFVFPPSANYTSQLVVYLWRGSGGKAFIDDVQLTAIH